MRLRFLALFLFALGSAVTSRADDARFDLSGPTLEVSVSRGGMTLPIAQVPNLLPHDVLLIRAEVPANQLNHLFVIVAFLRDTTDEPPDDWFTKIETWKQPATGTVVTVPDGAQRALLLVAPETGGGFSTIRSAVKGNPGLFIRSNKLLNKASLEQQRIQRYLAGMQAVALADQATIVARSARLAASLALKPNADCFKQPVEDQVDCLTQTSAPLLLDDGHGQSIATAITSGASSDFINEASTTGGGAYSAYIGTLVDLVHLIGMLHTAQYQYIPAISLPEGPKMNLKLNAPPSFNNPKSVIVIGLPDVQNSAPPRTRLPDAQPICLANPDMTLALRGSPVLFTTSYARDVSLHFEYAGSPYDIPIALDTLKGGLVVSDERQRRLLLDAVRNADKGAASTGVLAQGQLRGTWGFDPFDGSTMMFQLLPGKSWKLSGTDGFIAGQEATVTLQGSATGCIHEITLSNEQGTSETVTFKPAVGSDGKNALALAVPLKGVDPGQFSFQIQQYGSTSDLSLPVTAYDSTNHFERVVVHPGDDTALLIGRGVEHVASVEIGGQAFVPAGPGGDNNSLRLRALPGKTGTPGTGASVKLKNGRVMKVEETVEEPGSHLKLLSFESVPEQHDNLLEISVDTKVDIPLGVLNFVVQSEGAFPKAQTIEIATTDGSARTVLSLDSDSLILQDDHTAVGTVDLKKAFGESTFGILRLRAVPGDGTFGEWITLGRLVRIPRITAVRCTKVESPTCMIEGSNLFLAQAISMTKDFKLSVPVPNGFDEPNFALPTKNLPQGSALYMKLRDDPEAVATIRLQER